MALLINFFGGAGVGKTTIAAKLFSSLKQQGKSAYLVQEYVTNQWVNEDREVGPLDQLFFLGQQARAEYKLFNKYEYIITDSPLFLCAMYAKIRSPQRIANAIYLSTYQYYKTIVEDMNIKMLNYLIDRCIPYDDKHRYESLEEAKKVDKLLIEMLSTMNYESDNLLDYKTIQNDYTDFEKDIIKFQELSL
jgi:nicotinamide riboside kinase